MTAKEFRNVLYFLCNKWSQGECDLIFNGPGYNPDDWKFSIGEHIWNKWIEACEDHHGSLDGITYFLLSIDNNCLGQIIKRTEFYYERKL